jgi:uncharacterized protein (DUF4415 family)
MRNLLSLSDIFLLPDCVRATKPGVYFLIENGEIVYIGESKNPSERVRQHKAINFTHTRYIACGNRMNAELLYIKKFKPKHNIKKSVTKKRKSVLFVFDEDIYHHFKAQGHGYQEKINFVLRSYMESQK